MIIDDVTELVGNTPVLKIPQQIHGLNYINLYAKLELCNPFGSVKDRIAVSMLSEEIPRLQKESCSLIETSSGNTAKALAVLAQRAKIPFRLITSMLKVQETRDILKLLGVDVEEVSGAPNCFDPSDPNDPMYMIQKEVTAGAGKVYFTSQFTNTKNPEIHYRTTGEEIIKDLHWVDYLCAGLGTSGSTLGISKRLREENQNVTCIGVTASKGELIPGIRSIDQMMEAGFFDKSAYQEFVQINSNEAINGMLQLIRGVGLLCGPSSGANFAGALKYLSKIDKTLSTPKTAVFIACDRVEWYMSYLKDKRPELFGEKAKKYSLATLTDTDVTSAPLVRIADAQKWIAAEKPLIIDVRSNYAFGLGSITSAINIPHEDLEKILENKHPFVRGRTVLLVCPSGQITARYAAFLTKQGAKAYSLEGGLIAWRSMGYEIEYNEM